MLIFKHFLPIEELSKKDVCPRDASLYFPGQGIGKSDMNSEFFSRALHVINLAPLAWNDSEVIIWDELPMPLSNHVSFTP